jgi:hypothetical protein
LALLPSIFKEIWIGWKRENKIFVRNWGNERENLRNKENKKK